MKLIKVLSSVLIIISFNCSAQIKHKIANDSLVIDEFYNDLDSDGIKDKIMVYKNIYKKTDFEQQHFKLPIKIFKGNKFGYKLWAENNSLLFDNYPSCVSEGYSNIVIKNNFFTIESQSCYDYNILISVYMTFKVKNSKIYLYKYSEEYFDKSNHERVIPSKKLTIKDFGKKEFVEVIIESIGKKLKKIR